MIHFGRIMEIIERLRDIEIELEAGFSAEVETNLYAEQTELETEKARLEAEADDYRDGYQAGVEFHLGSGYDARKEDAVRSQNWENGFGAAGEDS